MSILEPFKKALESFCKENNLDFSKVLLSPRCGNKEILFIQRVDKSKANNSSNSSAEILLTATMDNCGNVIISKNENADKYLR